MSRCLDRLDMQGQKLLDLVRTVPANQSHFTRDIVRIYNIEQIDEVFGLHRWANLDPNGVLNPSEIFYVGAIELAGSVTDPEEMRREIVKFLTTSCGLALMTIFTVSRGSWTRRRGARSRQD